MTISKFDSARASCAKRAFSTRRVMPDRMKTLISGDLRPLAGDLVLARVDELGKQTKLELTDGRRAHMFPGDEIVVCFGNRYAPDQYEAVIGSDMSPCELVAAGGIAGMELSRHDRMLAPTKITPIGLIGDAKSQRLNLMQFRVQARDDFPTIPAILSLGTSMNAGKTLTATSIVRGLKRLGYSVAALKITGTGAGGDMWIVRDAGADVALDFTDAGFATTYLATIADIERGTFLLMNHAASIGCEFAVIEIADGLQQLETAQLIRSEAIRMISLGTVFAAYDAMGAKYGVDVLREEGHAVLAISGRLSRSPLGVREAEAATGLRVYTPWELQEGALVPAIREQAVERYAASNFRDSACRRIAQASCLNSLNGDGANGHDANGEGVIPSGDPTAPISGIDFAHAPRPPTPQEAELLCRIAARIMQSDITQICAASFGSRRKGRINRRNGFRIKAWITPLGPVPVRIPRLRHGHYRPSFLARAFGADDIDPVFCSKGAASLEEALTNLVAAIRGEPLDAPEMTALVSEAHALMRTAPRDRRIRPPDAGDPSPNGIAGVRRPWISFQEDEQEEEGEEEGLLEYLPRIGVAARASIAVSAPDFEAEDDRSAGLAFQAPHASAG